MPATVSHALSMTSPDDPLYENQPKHWNSAHALTFSVVGSEISGLFSNANGISFGFSGGQSITASHNALTTAMASNRGSDFVNATAAFAGTNASGTIASNGISVSVGNYITTAMASNRGSDFVQATAVFAGTNASGTIASDGISVSVAAGGGAGVTISEWPWMPGIPMAQQTKNSGTTGGTGGSTQHTASLYLVPQHIPANLSFNQMALVASANTVGGTGNATIGYFVGIYTMSNSTKLNLLSTAQFQMILSQNSETARSQTFWWGTNSTSNSTGTNGNVSASFTGGRDILLMTGANSLSAGQYVFAVGHTAITAGSNINASSSMLGHNNMGPFLPIGNNTAVQQDPYLWKGVLTTTTNFNGTGTGLYPSTIDATAFTTNNGNTQWPQVFFRTR